MNEARAYFAEAQLSEGLETKYDAGGLVSVFTTGGLHPVAVYSERSGKIVVPTSRMRVQRNADAVAKMFAMIAKVGDVTSALAMLPGR